MSSVNKVILVGNLGRDPESRTFPSGDKVVSFSLAMTESWRDKATGERKDKTEWVNVSIFNENIGKVAEAYCKKGSKVYLEGQLQTREYTDKDGNQRKSTEVVLQKFRGELTLLDSRKADGDAPREEAPRRRTASRDDDDMTRAYSRSELNRAASGDLDNDIPF